MERRELLRRLGCALTVALSGPMSLEAASYRTTDGHMDHLELCIQADRVYRAGRLPEALGLYKKAWDELPERTCSENAAALLERYTEVKERVESAISQLADQRSLLGENPKDNAGRLRLGNLLLDLDRCEEAAAEYQRILDLSKTEGDSEEDIVWQIPENALFGMGVCHYRRKRFWEAFAVFEAFQFQPADEAIWLACPQRRAMEHRVLVYARLKMTDNARETIRECIKRYGRLGERYREAAEYLEIDADALYVEHYRQQA